MTKQVDKWMGGFGDKYTARNSFTPEQFNAIYEKEYGIIRTELNNEFIGNLSRDIRVLEVGCNIGIQLKNLQDMGFKNLYGIEINKFAIEKSKETANGISIVFGNGFDIPYENNFFDLVFTSGVLIHISPEDINSILKEIHRCSRRYIWGCEYYADSYTEIEYYGCDDLLWKTDFATLFTNLFKDLTLLKERHINYFPDDGKDTMFLLEKCKRPRKASHNELERN